MRSVLVLRRVVAAAVLAGFVALFAGVVAYPLVLLARLQFVPAVLAASGVAVVVLLVTAVFGRWYCSVCCPLGLVQDVAFRICGGGSQAVTSPRLRLVVRSVVLALFLAAGFCGLGFAWIEPYGLFGRAASGLLPGAAIVAGIAALAAWKGRMWCGWVCPVGTALGLVSRLAPFRLAVDGEKCIGCGACARRCRASAIAVEGRLAKLDATVCVQCRDCTVLCPKGAIGAAVTMAAPRSRDDGGKTDGGGSRRGFLAGFLAAGAAVVAKGAPDEKTVDGGFAEVTEPGVDERGGSLKPAGARSLENFRRKCVACQLCVKACPNSVLRPSKRDFQRPEMAFDRGFCTDDCTKCGEVCPAGAIEPVAQREKAGIHIGTAVWHEDRCVAAAEGVNCTACFRHCPVKAIVRVAGKAGAKVPVVDSEKCIGCGACEHVCPSRPLPALVVRPLAVHRVA